LVDQQQPQQPYGYGQQQPQQPYGYGAQAPVPPGPPPFAQPAAKPGNGVAVAGLILAFLAPPIGLILSIIGLVKSGRAGRRGVAIAGLVISLVLNGIIGAVVVVALSNVGNVGNALDPGCTTSKTVMLDNISKLGDPATIQDGVQSVIDGLTSAESKASHDEVRNAVKTLKQDYIELQTVLKAKQQLPADLNTRLTTDGAAFA
jgi:hypothetical protein